MKNRFKNIFAIFILIFMFSAVSIVGNYFFDKNTKSAKALGDEIEISTLADFERYIGTYSVDRQDAKYVLKADLDLAELKDGENNPKVLKNTFGTEAAPFRGTFDGNGHTIKNLRFDFSTTIQGDELYSVNKYVGLFGVTNGATIKNLSISGTTTIVVGKCVNVYVGSLVAKANNTTIERIQNNAKMSLSSEDVFAHNVNLGSLVGMATDSTISYVISRTSDFGVWTLNDRDDRRLSVGGIVGTLSNTELSFAVGASKFEVSVGTDFYGTLNIGGVAGTISQAGAKVVNTIVENTMNVVVPQLGTSGYIYKGNVAGVVSNPVPDSGNLSYIYYKPNTSGINIFGAQGSYEKRSESDIDDISTLPKTPEAFNGYRWHFEYGNWDFGKVWYLNAGVVYLQNFYGTFVVELGTELTSGSIIELKQDFANAYRYGDSVKITFGFKKVIDGSNTIDLSEYYSLKSLTLGGNDLVAIDLVDGEYELDDTEDFLLSKSGENYVLTIKHVDRSTASLGSAYDIRCESKKFNLTITSKLYEDDVVQEGKIPAEVYITEMNGTSVTNPSYKKTIDTNVAFTNRILIRSRIENITDPAAFVGWYVEKDGNDVKITENEVLEILFGHGEFKEETSVYAKYERNACVVTFMFDDGVKSILLFSGSYPITKENRKIAISKEETQFKIEVYINEGYTFDVKKFIALLDTYKPKQEGGEDSKFCIWLNENDPDRQENYYQFSLDMTILEGQFSDAFSIDIQTTQTKGGRARMRWIIIGGSIGGAVVIAGVIILIIVLKRRNGGFGGGYGGGKSSFKKSSYKDMYY